MNRKTSSIQRIAAVLIVCGLLPGTAWSETKSRQRTGQFRLENDQLLVDTTGQSRISVQDYAVAMIDRLIA
jgi:hypothetical protein